ncbi:DNA polymerase delta subunit 3 [Camellia lanceoleosa]|uniref:DNA polymerase delta subunit 3 n=1 Tax=Camellia lanceoleosa TaxID=1840588 RepID=A0ACC0HAX6_9ERIC|nr:DNA polymerase delta subunit 3 [Camellia lanceoleosa]
MAEVETLGILEEIQALVSDKLQVVSYKWLSRNFLLPSNVSKRLLQEFVEKHGNGFEVVYTLSGWLKNNPSVYHIRLVSGPKLSESKQQFDGNCSVQVYSVQACIPKDPAALWNAEFVQAEELFRQPPTIENCLRDNRFCGISNSFVKRNADGTAVSIAAPQPKNAVVAGPSRSNSMIQKATIPQPQQKKVQQSSPKVGLESSNVVKSIKTEGHVSGSHEQAGKPSSDKEKAPQLPANKKKGENDKSTSGNGGSLANMWGRAAAKPKHKSATTETNVPIPIVSAEAQICACEAIEATSSDDDGQDVNFKRASKGEGSRKRRVVFDFSDEDDEYKDAVNLASPDPPKSQTFLDKQTTKSPIPEKISMDIDTQKVVKPKVKEETVAKKETNQLSREDSSDVSKRKTEISSSDKVHSLPENNVNAKDKVVDAASTSPKRRKVLKTRIDERGREVTEVVWEGGETETKADSNTMKNADNNSVSNTVNRAAAPAAKKSPAVGGTAPSNPGGKAGNKKAANVKDPKQGNIMSFFKRV